VSTHYCDVDLSLPDGIQRVVGTDQRDRDAGGLLEANDDEDWSFGYGRAQFLTGELK
jgi:hypothetical protein